MSTQPTTPKPQRGPRRNAKRVTTTPIPSSNGPFIDRHSTPPRAGGSPPTPSRDGSSVYDSANNLSEGGPRKRKGKKNRDSNNPANQSPAVSNGVAIGHRHSASQPSINSPSATRDGTCYAGPTFHASPAPSALPIPTFFSKSVPDSSGLHQSADTESESQDTEAGESTPSKSRSMPHDPGDEAHASPLDFLFKAARDAKAAIQSNDLTNGSGRGSPTHQGRKSLQTPQLADSAMFPFELDGSESKKMNIGPAFATPYKERMNALRSASSPPRSRDSTPIVDEDRKAKAEALKDLLLNPRPQRPSSISSLVQDKTSEPKVAGPATPHKNADTPVRHSSGPPTPVSALSYNQRPSPRPLGGPGSHGRNNVPHQYLASLTMRTPSSGLRKEISPASPASPHSPSEHNRQPRSPLHHSDLPGHFGHLVSPTPNRTLSSVTSSTSPARGVHAKMDPMDMRRMEDDLRRILKVDMSQSHSPQSLGHSVA